MIILSNSDELITFLNDCNNAYLMGAGNVAHQLLHFLFLKKIKCINSILVSNSNDNPKSLDSYPVIDFNNVDLPDSSTFILATTSVYWNELSKTILRKYNNAQIVALSSSLIDYLSYESLDNGSIARQPRAMLRFEVHLAEHCNLNCKGCSHFSPLAEPEFIDINEYSRDLAQLSKLFYGEVEYIHLMGGEPLLNPNINKIFDITRKYFPVGHLQLITNGILLSEMPEDFWESCQKNEIEIMPTKYPINVSYEESLKEKALKHHLHYQIYNIGDSEKSLYSFKLSEYGGQPIEPNFYRCEMANSCINLSHGKLYTCVFPPYVHHLNKYFNTKFCVSKNDGIDIYKANSGREIMEKLARPIPFCRYCEVSKREYGLPYGISSRDKSEWID